MKRTYSDMASCLTVLPKLKPDDPKLFKSTLNGTLRFRVVKVVDISKPTDKPIEAIDQEENEESTNESRLSKNSARVIQLDLKDAHNCPIRAVETEYIPSLNNVKADCLIEILGPIDMRCGNLMLEKKHDIQIEVGPTIEVETENSGLKEEQPDSVVVPEHIQQVACDMPKSSSAVVEPPISLPPITLVELEEDWEDDDCIILD